MHIVTILILAVGGWFTWTLSEYCLHRWAMHELMGRGLISREHLAHHTAPNATRFGPLTWLQWTGIALIGTGLSALVVLAIGPLGWIFGASWAIGYAWYEVFHARSHLCAPMRVFRTYDLRLRRHHFGHHFGHPMSNHGVTIALWDRVFGTLEAPELIRVPQAMAPAWLLGEDGAVRAEYAVHYEVVGDSSSRAVRREALAAARAALTAA